MKKYLLLPLALLITNTAFSANWVNFGKTSNDEFTTYIDTNSIKKINGNNSNLVRYFAKREYPKAQKEAGGKYYNYNIAQVKVDCTNEKRSLSALVFYTKNGNVVDAVSYSSDKWNVIYPDSIGASELAFVCRYVGY